MCMDDESDRLATFYINIVWLCLFSYVTSYVSFQISNKSLFTALQIIWRCVVFAVKRQSSIQITDGTSTHIVENEYTQHQYNKIWLQLFAWLYFSLPILRL
mgnify:CR=1 FL=1